MNNERMERIIEQLGEAFYSSRLVREQFAFKSEAEILNILNETYVYDDCAELANMIYQELN